MRASFLSSTVAALALAAGVTSSPAVAPVSVVATAKPVDPVTVITVAQPVTTTNTTVVVKPTSSTTSTKIVTSVVQNGTTTTTTSTITSAPGTQQTQTEPVDTDILTGTRTTDILATITGLPPVPTNIDSSTNLNLTDIQGDILVGMHKKLEVFYFFVINDPKVFKKVLHTQFVSKITNTWQLLSVATQPIVAINLAFSYTGLAKIGYPTTLADGPFTNGQWADAGNLRDTDPPTNWEKVFQGQNVHGVFLVASDQQSYLDAQLYQIATLFGSSITNVYSLQGNIRPPPNEGHEMFGFLDGIGQPAVNGFNIPLPGQEIVDPGIILTGEVGDTLAGARPSWAKNGSFLVFRKLRQFVGLWDTFIAKNAPQIPGWTQEQSAELLGARMIGRWKSGAPIDLTPTVDNIPLANDPNQNNNFDYTHPGYSLASDQYHCPFAAHIRKTRPRADLTGTSSGGYGGKATNGTIMRAGIPYGPEPKDCGYQGCDEDGEDRGLAFVAYQSQIDQGFQFIQTVWANDPNFATGKTVQPGWDPVVGQNNGAARFMTGYDITNTNAPLNLWEEFVISNGGEYFYSPSINALANVLSI